MTLDELKQHAEAFAVAMGQFRRDNPDTATSIIEFGVIHGNHVEDRGWWILSCNKVNPVPYRIGSPEREKYVAEGGMG